MRKLLFLLLVVFAVFACQKKDNAPAVSTTQDVEFGITEVDPGLKGTDDWLCPTNMNVDYAKIKIAGFTDPFYPLVFRLNGKLYTQAIKLPIATYTVEEFYLMRDEGTIGDYTDDQVVMATPLTGSDYEDYVAYPMTYEFTVGEFTKTEVPIEVLCYLDVDYDLFGFNWFAIKEIVVREVCFFGDICLNGDPHVPAYLNGSDYGAVVTAPDVIAYMKIVVRGDAVGLPQEYFNNNNYNDALCVEYPDDLGATDDFYFDLFLWLPDATGVFTYQLYHTFTATDAGPLSTVPGDDDVIDFVVGTCNYSEANLQLDWIVFP